MQSRSEQIGKGRSHLLTRRDALARAAVGASALALGGAGSAALAADAASHAESQGSVIHNNHINQTICKWCYVPKHFTLDQLCQQAVRLGYRAIDLVSPPDFPTLKKYNLMGTMVQSHSIPKGLNRRANWDECLAKIRAGMDAASEAGYPNVICFSGNRNGMDDHEGQKNCAEALKLIVGEAEKKNVTICMELLNSKVNHPDYMCDHSAWGVELAKSVGSDHFKLLYDIYHMQIMEGDVIATIRKNHQYFGHYHTGGVPGRNEIDQTQELNYAPIMQAIAATGYKGWVGQEFLPLHDPAASLAQAAKICDV